MRNQLIINRNIMPVHPPFFDSHWAENENFEQLCDRVEHNRIVLEIEGLWSITFERNNVIQQYFERIRNASDAKAWDGFLRRMFPNRQIRIEFKVDNVETIQILTAGMEASRERLREKVFANVTYRGHRTPLIAFNYINERGQLAVYGDDIWDQHRFNNII